jgi:hypothetical protein
MHAKSTAGHPAGTSAADLVLERLPSGELAWLRPEQPDDDPRHALTDLGRRALAMEHLFGHCPTGSEFIATAAARSAA